MALTAPAEKNAPEHEWEHMQRNKAASLSQAALLALLLAGILAVVNLYADRHFFRIDLTENRRYTISDSTRAIVGGLEDIVTIKVYLSRKLPPYAIAISEHIRDMLEEYRIYAGGMLS